ncbi:MULTISPECIES: TIGR02450 family Trp-rich protein [unclassified Prochlorococcus]|uniref:TIGR02450 family Trp-rich protein n=1 Tax=unclassified Prochlorococcus TaxID=2627481 RepID=UPI0005338612|nr:MULTISPECIES: TIGR02450 family Trp-rich protein [unclassified Prochlorococcus]KGG15095.1 hypothetical protein EV06_0959 [Prochlorococcus sp. MIT 0602]KGG17367.1 hypothetical protein EV07_0805 [Prochlorococcus sp. MIT 0603]
MSKAEWPPVKAWTSVKLIKSNRYFVAINYGIDNEIYWVNLVSVLDGNICFRVNFDQLNNSSIWIEGWVELADVEVDHDDFLNLDSDLDGFTDIACLHPSKDSGLSIGSSLNDVRRWFPL